MARHYIRWFEEIGIGDVASVGGKNASLGEMVRNLGRYGIKVPPGFATTADGYLHFLSANNLEPLIALSSRTEKHRSLKSARRSAPRC
jgi:pyruvate, water dikinase